MNEVSLLQQSEGGGPKSSSGETAEEVAGTLRKWQVVTGQEHHQLRYSPIAI